MKSLTLFQLPPMSWMTGTVLLLLCLLSFEDVYGDWIDPDTPDEFHTTRSLTLDENFQSIHYRGTNRTQTYVDHTKLGRKFHLVMSDEFNTPGRQFGDGTDPKWTALEKNDYTNDALHYYSSSNIYTNDEGELEIVSEAADTEIIGFNDKTLKQEKVTKHFRSGMLQSWNKFCFTGGIIEAEVQLPGYSDIGGLWPAFWLLGNLARHTYVASSTHVWPFSSHECSPLTKYAQKINGCLERTHYDMAKEFGRGSPEIDIFEMQPGPVKANTGQYLKSYVGQPFMSASYQFAPGSSDRPGTGWWPGPGQWYEGMNYGNDTCLNIVFYGVYNAFAGDTDPRQAYWSDALSYNRQLTPSHFKQTHKYRVEWGLPDLGSEDEYAVNMTQPVDDSTQTKKRTGFKTGYLNWYLDDELVMAVNGSSIEAKGLGGAIASEPMSILFNTAISKQWGFPKLPDWCPGKVFNCLSKDPNERCGFDPFFCEMMTRKPTMKVNYVRVWQDLENPKHKVGCSTPERPTRKYIIANQDSFKEATDAVPLKPIQRGRGICSASGNTTKDVCGGFNKGTCTMGGVCECLEGWTGPHCLVPDGYDDIQWDEPDTISDLNFDPPSSFFTIAKPLTYTLVAMCILLLLVVTFSNSGKRNRGYTPGTTTGGWKKLPEVSKSLVYTNDNADGK